MGGEWGKNPSDKSQGARGQAESENRKWGQVEAIDRDRSR